MRDKIEFGITGVVGLDLSLTSTGVARFDIDGSETVQAIATDKKDFADPGERFDFILKEMLKSAKEDDEIFIEDYAWHQGAGSSLVSLGELNGIVKYLFWRRGKWPTVVNINTIKKWAGAMHKDEMRLAAYKRFGVEFKTTDEIDAYVLADFGWCVTFGGHGHKNPKVKGKDRILTKWEHEIWQKFLAPKKSKNKNLDK